MATGTQRRRLEGLVHAATDVLYKCQDLAAEQGLGATELALGKLWVDVMRVESALLLAQNPTLRSVDLEAVPPGTMELPF